MTVFGTEDAKIDSLLVFLDVLVVVLLARCEHVLGQDVQTLLQLALGLERFEPLTFKSWHIVFLLQALVALLLIVES